MVISEIGHVSLSPLTNIVIFLVADQPPRMSSHLIEHNVIGLSFKGKL